MKYVVQLANVGHVVIEQSKTNALKTAEGLGGSNIKGTEDKKTQYDVGQESGRGENF